MGNFKLYLVVFFLFCVIRAVQFYGTPNMPVYVLLTLLDIGALAGIFGYSFKKLIVSRALWQFFIFPYMLRVAYVFYVLIVSFLSKLTKVTDIIIIFLVHLILNLTAVYILFLYAFKTNWAGAEDAGKTEGRKK